MKVWIINIEINKKLGGRAQKGPQWWMVLRVNGRRSQRILVLSLLSSQTVTLESKEEEADRLCPSLDCLQVRRQAER